MYDLSGLYYKAIVDGLVFGLGGISFVIGSRFWNAEKKKIKELFIGLICCFICIISIGYNYYVINDLKISVHEGVFIRQNRESPYLFREEYCFSNEKGLNPIFYLDIFSKKDVYPEDFEKDVRYTIHFEERTKVIVKVKKIE